jgi:hypothetical protein
MKIRSAKKYVRFSFLENEGTESAYYRVLEAKAQRQCTSQAFELFSILQLKILTFSLHCNLLVVGAAEKMGMRSSR